MLRARHLLHWLLLLASAAGSSSAYGSDAGVARITVDFAGGTVRAEADGHEISFSVDGDSLRAELSSLAASLARGEDAPSLRSEAGRELLGPLFPVLATVAHWIVDAATPDVPGPLGVLSSLSLPWDASDAPVLTRHAVTFDWPHATGRQSPVPRTAGHRGSGILLVAPFERAVAPSSDDPDTLRRALRAGAANVDLLPRNELSPEDLARALADSRPALLWVRATDEQLTHLRPALELAPDLVVWTPPSRARGSQLVMQARSLGPDGSRPRVVVVQLWAGPESARGPSYRAIVDALARGLAVEDAVVESQRLAARSGLPASVWAGWAVVGEPDLRIRIDRAPWLRRWFGPR